MADFESGSGADGTPRKSSPMGENTPVVAPRFDERESATARPVVPLGGTGYTSGASRPSLRAITRHLLLAWAVVATLAAGAVAVYRGGNTTEPPVAPQPSPEANGATAVTPQPARRDPPITRARSAKMTETRSLLPAREQIEWSDRGERKLDDPDEEEEFTERERKEEKRRRKEEKKRREEAEDEIERARKEARQQAKQLRERQKGNGSKTRLIGVITGQD